MTDLYFAQNLHVRFEGDRAILMRDDQALPLKASTFEKLARALSSSQTTTAATDDETLGCVEVRSSLERLRWLQFVTETPAPVTANSEQPAGDVAPFELGTYRLLRPIGSGGFGRVFEALDLERRTSVAIKLLRKATPSAVHDLKREARAVSDLTHANLLSSHEFGFDGRIWFLVMELVDGLPLSQALGPAAWKRSSEEERIARTRDAFRQLTEALLALHSNQLLHLDLKPANVLLRHQGGLAVLDFGQARHLLAANEAGALFGTLEYSAPERRRRERPRASSDWYSVGVMLHEVLTGALPGQAAEGEALPEDLRDLCRRLLLSDPDARASGMDLLRVLGGSNVPLRSNATFVGRDRELAALAIEFEHSYERSACVLIVGEHGIGKSALAQRFLSSVGAHSDGPVIVRGACFQSEHFPLKAFDSILQQLPQQQASNVVSHLLEMRTSATFNRPLVVFVDDAQWVDEESLAAVKLLFAARPKGLLVVATAPSSFVKSGSRLSEFFDTLQGRPTRHLRLLPLDERDARRLAVAVLAEQGSNELATKVATMGRGVPDLIRNLAQQRGRDISGVEPPHIFEPPSTSFVGRAIELAQLQDAYRLARSGRTVVCVVEGDAGIGKTALVDHFIEEQPREDVLVVRGICSERSPIQYEPLEPLALTLARELRLPDRLLPYQVGLLFPVLRDSCSESTSAWTDTAAARRRVAHELASGVAGLDGFPILVFDNLHCANVDSARLLMDMLAAPEFPPALVVLLQRATVQSVAARIVEDFRARPPSHVTIGEVTIGRLSNPELLQLASNMREMAIVPDSLAHLVSASEGNPLALLAVLSADSGIRTHTEPTDLMHAMARVLESLSDVARQYLEIVCLSLSPLAQGAVAILAGLDGDERSVVAALRARRLIFTTGGRPSDRVAVASDLVRDLVVPHIEKGRLGRLHDLVATHLAGIENTSAATRAYHLRGAGRLQDAKVEALRAAHEALQVMAPETAAEHFGLALECCDEPRETETVALARADALASAGRGTLAGKLFVDLAGSPSCLEPLALRARGAEQLLLGGDVGAGVPLIKSLAAEAGLDFPESSGRAVLGALARLAWLWVRRRLSVRDTVTKGARRHSRLAVAASAFRGLVPVDPGRASYFAVRELELAIASGDPRYTATCLAWVGAAVLGPGPRVLARAGSRLVERAAAAACNLRDSELDGWIHISRAALAFWNGAWQAAVAEVRAGFLLVEGHVMLRHERNIAQVVALRSLEELGDWDEVARTADEMYRDALARGDSYAEVSACLYCAFSRLAQGEPGTARRWADHGLARWTGEPWSVQEVYSLRVHLYADLHDGRCESAWERLENAWPGFAKGMHLAIRTSRIDLELLRGRIALACAEGLPEKRPRYLKETMRSIRQLKRAERADAHCHALLLSAGVASLMLRREEARVSLEQARVGYDRLGMRVYAAAVRLQAARLADDALALQDAEEALRASGIRNPRAWLSLYAPGFNLHEREARHESQVSLS